MSYVTATTLPTWLACCGMPADLALQVGPVGLDQRARTSIRSDDGKMQVRVREH